MHAPHKKHSMTHPPRANPNAPVHVLRPTLVALCLLAPGVWPVASSVANAQAVASGAPIQFRVDAGTQKELLIPKGIERMAIADETVAGVALTRQSPNSPAARLILTGKTAGRTTLMLWEKGQSTATVYALEVRRRASTLTGTLDSMTAHQEARDAALAAGGEKALLVDRSVVNVRSNTVQV